MMTVFIGVLFPNDSWLEWLSVIIAFCGSIIVLMNYLESRVERRIAIAADKHPIYLDTADELVRKDRMRLEFLALWFLVGCFAMLVPSPTGGNSWVAVFARCVYVYVEVRTVVESFLEKRYKIRLESYTKSIYIVDRKTGVRERD